MINKCRVLLLLSTLLLVPVQVLAWGDTTHMVIAQISYSRLNPTAQARVDQFANALGFEVTAYKLFKNYDAITIATYMDDLRSDPSKNYIKPWHFIDIPFFSGIEAVAISPSEPNVESQINYCFKTLKSDRTLSLQQQAELVAYLIHLVGDAHQPLHTTTRYTPDSPRGDMGGNAFLIEGARRNLHSYWDAAALLFAPHDIQRPLRRADLQAIRDYALKFQAAYPPDSPEWRDMNVSHWVKESHALAISAVYNGIQQGSNPSEAYQARAQDVCRKRMAMSGYRLAELLNELYPQSTNPPRPRAVRTKAG